MDPAKEKIIQFKVERFDPQPERHYLSTYEVPISKGTTLLDALLYIKEKLDGTLTFRHSCRMGICGSCGVNINGKPMLACYTQVLDLKVDSLIVEPLSGLRIIKDLIVDIQPFFDTFRKIKPFLIRPEQDFKVEKEFHQTPTDVKKYWDLTLCTKCSICHSTCPAAKDDRFLGPSSLTANYRFIMDSRDKGLDERLQPMTDNIWLCTSCDSCSKFCPKSVDCSKSIVENRGLLVERGVIPRTVKDVLESVYKYHNPMGTPQAKRMDWARDLHVETFPTTAKADVLFFVCCSNVYDLRNQEAARTMASVFDKMGVTFATLGAEEWCCGDHILRMGEKGLFEELAEHNISMFKKFEAEKIVTLSPHCYNTFKNDKPYNDAKLNVQHYTQFLAEVLSKGKMEIANKMKRRVAYHDPCFLGKRNGIYDQPRQILQSINGLELVEMKRRKECSYCCGGGGGRVFTEEAESEKRPSVERIKEAMELGVETIAVACPFCVTTLEDAVKVLDLESKIAVKDISELLKEALQLPSRAKNDN